MCTSQKGPRSGIRTCDLVGWVSGDRFQFFSGFLALGVLGALGFRVLGFRGLEF